MQLFCGEFESSKTKVGSSLLENNKQDYMELLIFRHGHCHCYQGVYEAIPKITTAMGTPIFLRSSSCSYYREICIIKLASKRGKKKNFVLIQDMSEAFAELTSRLSSLRQFLAAESPLKMKKNAFYFTLKALFVLKLSTFLS